MEKIFMCSIVGFTPCIQLSGFKGYYPIVVSENYLEGFPTQDLGKKNFWKAIVLDLKILEKNQILNEHITKYY